MAAFLFAALTAAPALTAQQQPAALAHPVALLDVVFNGEGANSRESDDLIWPDSLGQFLRTALEREAGLTILSAARVPAPACPTHTCAVAAAREAGATWVVTARLSKLSGLIWFLSAQLSGTATGYRALDLEWELKGIKSEWTRLASERLARRVGTTARRMAPVVADGKWPRAYSRVALEAALAAGDRPDLTGAELGGLDLSGLDFRGAILARAYLTGTRLDGTNLTGADLTDARLDGASLRRARLDGAVLTRADLTTADLTGASATGARFDDALLGYTRFGGVDVADADVTGADLLSADFRTARGTARLRGLARALNAAEARLP